MRVLLCLCVALSFAAIVASSPLLPILCVHGWQGYATDFANITKEVNANFPGRYIASVNLFDGKLSEKLPLYEQARRVRAFIENDPQLRGGQKFILIGHSQGTLVSRALLEEWDDHPVQMFLSLAGPHLGQYGLFADLVSNPFLRGLATEAAWTILYTQLAQDSFCASNFWRDPNHHEEFLTEVVFLPQINNYVEHANSSRFRANFARTPSVHLFGSPHDDVIIPWQSSLIGFWNISNPSQMLNMSEVPEFTKDLFGLQTLETSKRLFLHEVAGVLHQDWLNRADIFSQHILPLLSLQ